MKYTMECSLLRSPLIEDSSSFLIKSRRSFLMIVTHSCYSDGTLPRSFVDLVNWYLLAQSWCPFCSYKILEYVYYRLWIYVLKVVGWVVFRRRHENAKIISPNKLKGRFICESANKLKMVIIVDLKQLLNLKEKLEFFSSVTRMLIWQK